MSSTSPNKMVDQSTGRESIINCDGCGLASEPDCTCFRPLFTKRTLLRGDEAIYFRPSFRGSKEKICD